MTDAWTIPPHSLRPPLRVVGLALTVVLAACNGPNKGPASSASVDTTISGATASAPTGSSVPNSGSAGADNAAARPATPPSGTSPSEADWQVFKNEFFSIATPTTLGKVSDEGNDVTFRSADGSVVANVSAIDGANASIVYTDQDAKNGPTGEESSACANLPPSYILNKDRVSAYSCIGKNGKMIYEVQKIYANEISKIFHMEYPIQQKQYWDGVVIRMSHSLG